ncbi:hypothetical protein D8B25_15515 [Verminephrobacter aporrectodeae subsp. tuberculatae]|nr:hypothetical protein [Verminephrobacter aporrectodeae subsp. tuberculatae]MCW8203754.1 hypothetical protein [Verminephrobacter aporrectodeae subsp. tuberculatae]
MTTKPIFHSDQPAKNDSLGWSNFAKNLARSLSLPEGSDESIVVGIEGEWGSGKSTLIGLIKKSLSEEGNADPKPIIIEFNPWMVSGTEALVECLITQIAAGIGKNSGEKALKAASAVLRFSSSIKNLKSFKYWPEPTIALFGVVCEAIGGASEDARKSIKEHLSEIDLSKRRSDAINGLAKLNRSLIVIIDDLDRLPPEEIRSMIQTIKAVVDFPRTLYLLAYDRSIVARALGSNNEEDGLRYLEKIVQVAYPIPPISQRQLKKFAEEKISNLLTELSITLRPSEKSFYERAIAQAASLSRHMRDIVRIVNRLSLVLPIIYKEVNVADAIVFEALSQRFPELRENICNHPLHFCGRPFPDGISDADLSVEEWATREEELARTRKAQQNGDPHWAEFLPKGKEEQQVADSACRFLFSSSEDSPSIHGLRMADPGRLARYLRCTTIDGVPDAEEIHGILSDPVKLEQELSGDNKELSSLLRWLIDYIPSCSATDVEGCIEKLIDKSPLGVELETSNKISKVMGKLLKHAARTLDERKKCFLNIIEKASIHVSASIVCDAKKERSENHPLFKDNAFLEESIEKFIGRAWKVINGGLDGDFLRHVLYRLHYLQNKSSFHTAISKMCETDGGLARFLSCFDYLKTNDHLEIDPLNSIFNLIPEDLAKQIENSDSNEKYSWFIKLLTERKTKLVSQKGSSTEI